MNQPQPTHHSTVTADQIDHLGHMNVRYYGVNAMRGTEEFLRRIAPEGPGLTTGLGVSDIYTRHHREQLLGTDLILRTGVLDADRERIRLYHELAAQESDILAATFVHTIVPDSRSLAAAIIDRSNDWAIELPEHGRSRSIVLDVDPLATAPTLDEAKAAGLAMREPRQITAEECDANGVYERPNGPMLIWGGTPFEGSSLGPMLHDGPNGEKMGWASMETRLSVRRLPEVGDRIQSFGATIDLRDKTSHRAQWAFDVDRGDLLVSFEVVSLAFDTAGRRAMSIPDHVRASEQATLRPDLAPSAASTSE